MDRGVTVFSSRIERWQLRPGDHIYAWRRRVACAYPHHGIYESDKKVIHFAAALPSSFIATLGKALAATTVTTVATAAAAAGGPEAAAATAGSLLGRAAKAASYALCRECHEAMRPGGVVKCCLNCFLQGDNLCLFAYGVPSQFYAASNIQGLANQALQTCTEYHEDPPDRVLRRANDLHDRKGFGSYDALVNNCFDFAFYCKRMRYEACVVVSGNCMIM